MHSLVYRILVAQQLATAYALCGGGGAARHRLSRGGHRHQANRARGAQSMEQMEWIVIETCVRVWIACVFARCVRILSYSLGAHLGPRCETYICVCCVLVPLREGAGNGSIQGPLKPAVRAYFFCCLNSRMH
eukprot:9500802-Pyramimonas_sp.AAC.1